MRILLDTNVLVCGDARYATLRRRTRTTQRSRRNVCRRAEFDGTPERTGEKGAVRTRPDRPDRTSDHLPYHGHSSGRVGHDDGQSPAVRDAALSDGRARSDGRGRYRRGARFVRTNSSNTARNTPPTYSGSVPEACHSLLPESTRLVPLSTRDVMHAVAADSVGSPIATNDADFHRDGVADVLNVVEYARDYTSVSPRLYSSAVSTSSSFPSGIEPMHSSMRWSMETVRS